MKKGLTEVATQLSAIWKQLGVNQRVSLSVASAALLLGLLALLFFAGRGSYSQLYAGLDEAEAAKIVAALDEAKVPYQIRGPGTVYVASDQLYSAKMRLASQGLPGQQGVGFEIFDKSNFGVSDFVQRANFKRAVEGTLARCIQELEAIEAAWVQVVIPENRLLIDNQRKPTASVLVKVRRNAQLPESAVSSIRFLVANAVEGLAIGNVSVVDTLGNVLSTNDDDRSISGLSNNQLKAQRDVELYLSRKAEDMLTRVLGPGLAVVKVHTDINWNTRTTYEEKYDPESQVVRSEIIEDEEVEQLNGSGGGGVTGIAANTNTDPTNAVATTSSSPTTTSKTAKKLTNNQYDVNRTVSSLLQNAGNVERLTAAVTVAQRFDTTGPDRKPLPRSQEELDKLRRIVQSALGIVESDPNRQNEITLEELPFNDQPLLELNQQLDREHTRQFWTDLGFRLLYPALGLVFLILFWRTFNRTRPEEIPLGLPLGDLAPGQNGNGNGHGDTFVFARRSEPKTVTVEVLNQLIRENPGNMTQAVRTWLTRGKAAK